MIRFEYAADHGLLYVKIASGPAAETIEIEDSVSVDLDADGQPIGVEFLHADDFLPFLERRGGVFAVFDAEGDKSTAAANSCRRIRKPVTPPH